VKVLVTGAGGFIGSHLVERLVKDGHEVRAFVKYNSLNRWGWLEYSEVKRVCEIISGDIRDNDIVDKAVRGVEVVFHLAALIGIPYSYVSPKAYVDVNVKGTANVLEAALRYDAKVVHTSTSEVYGTAQYVPIDEKHPINPQSPYAATKASADWLAITYYRSFDLPVVVVRPFNTFGPRQSARAVIPTIITQILAGRREIKLGNTDTTRDFNYVENTVDGFVKVGMSDKGLGDVFNIGYGKEISIGELVNLVARLIGREVDIIVDKERVRPEKSEVRRLLSDFSKAREIFSYEPIISLEKGLEKTIEWFADKNNLQLYKPDLYNI